MLITKDEDGRIVTPFLFLDGEVIELVLSGEILSDRGQTHNAIKTQTDRPADMLRQYGEECALGLGVQHRHGAFLVEGVTEETLEEAVARLANAMLLFYGLSMGADRTARNVL